MKGKAKTSTKSSSYRRIVKMSKRRSNQLAQQRAQISQDNEDDDYDSLYGSAEVSNSGDDDRHDKHTKTRGHHNKLERQRRDHLKDSFDALIEVIPDLHGVTSSQACRGVVLDKSAHFIKKWGQHFSPNSSMVKNLEKHALFLKKFEKLLSEVERTGVRTPEYETALNQYTQNEHLFRTVSFKEKDAKEFRNLAKHFLQLRKRNFEVFSDEEDICANEGDEATGSGYIHEHSDNSDSESDDVGDDDADHMEEEDEEEDEYNEEDDDAGNLGDEDEEFTGDDDDVDVEEFDYGDNGSAHYF